MREKGFQRNTEEIVWRIKKPPHCRPREYSYPQAPQAPRVYDAAFSVELYAISVRVQPTETLDTVTLDYIKDRCVLTSEHRSEPMEKVCLLLVGCLQLVFVIRR